MSNWLRLVGKSLSSCRSLLKGLSPNTISAAIIEFWPEPLQNFLAYIPYKPQNLFSNSVTKFHDFVTKAYSATDPSMKFLFSILVIITTGIFEAFHRQAFRCLFAICLNTAHRAPHAFLELRQKSQSTKTAPKGGFFVSTLCGSCWDRTSDAQLKRLALYH